MLETRTQINKIKGGYILPSAAYTIDSSQIRYYSTLEKTPEVGDLVYGTVARVIQHVSLENKEGRIHAIHEGSRAIFVLGNRYAPDYFEGLVPGELPRQLDMLARSGVVGEVTCRNSLVKEPTQIKVRGYVCDSTGNVLNTRHYPRITPKTRVKKPDRSKLVLVTGTSMNCGKSLTAAACCWALSTMGHGVRASKVTGTASLKDILLMEDNGASPVADFTFLGYPSTYMLSEQELLHIFNSLDLKYANSPRRYWVVEFADGILQRETAMLLHSPDVRSRIHRHIFDARDAFGAIGGLDILREEFGLVPDAISGFCSSSPLGVRELREHTDLPIFDSAHRDLKQLASVLI